MPANENAVFHLAKGNRDHLDSGVELSNLPLFSAQNAAIIP
ncbi:hypothetical protein [Modicisalibacter muralis]|nr:hypothetical protein [Halomonas muralis]